ncbi:chondroadherin-like b [Carcharodon carcharias]|uniref:chondroadherin-like b n=1 Tax=Carcharodon carcharias TaxID=13397 RepID=UPI001B7ED4E3|nr:chondroadherin-like b [Carcharodon carcharias]XP_041033583.1 chondroadherin-like b [Carcharodon carcharias]
MYLQCSCHWLLGAVLTTLVAGTVACPSYCICDNFQRVVTCIRKQLTEVPTTIPEATKKLDIKGNNINIIPNGAFLPIPYLTHLNLQKCKVQHLAEGAFRGLGQLIYLNLGFNSIEFIYQETFDGLMSLQQLIIDNNRIEEIRPGAFGQLGFLNFLNLGGNLLVYLPPLVFQGLQQIKHLRLSNNMVNNIADEAFAGLWTLKRLSLDDNELQYMPSEALSRLKNVARLDLGQNPMTYLGEESVRMQSLKHLTLGNMALQEVSHAAFVHSPKLAVIDFRYNQLQAMQPLEGVEALRMINLTGNPIQCNCLMRPFHEWMTNSTKPKAEVFCSAPSVFRGERLDSLRLIDLKCESRPLDYEEEEELKLESKPETNNQENLPCPEHCDCKHDLQHSSCEGKGLRKIPKGFPIDARLLDMRYNDFYLVPKGSFSDLKNLVSLHMQNCQIHDIHAGAFRGLKKLIYLYLSGNEISSLQPAIFEGLPDLTYLYLDYNKLSVIPKGAFKLLPNLFALHLEYNPIPRLTDENMEGAEKIRWLYLTGSNITYISPTALQSIGELQKLFLDENKLTAVPTVALMGMPILDELKLSNNPIKQIGNAAFLPVAGSLQHLWLNDMGLEKIFDGAFDGLDTGLESLHLENNKLSYIPSLKKFTNLHAIDLSNNPWNCDCPLLHLRRWIENTNLKVTAICDLPTNATGLNVQDAPFKDCKGNLPEKSKSASSKAGLKKRKSKKAKQHRTEKKDTKNKAQ